MRDPHVKALHYRVVHIDTVDYEKAVLLDHETDVFKVHIENGTAIFELKTHYADIVGTRAAVEPFISSWEALVYLNYGADEFQLRYVDAEVIDRNPEPQQKGSKVIAVGMASSIEVAGRFTAHVRRGSYPEPPRAFVVSADVDVMLLRYKLYRQDRDRISNMGYFVYTVLTQSPGGKKEAAHLYSISQTVLRKLSELTTTKGGKDEGRKAPYGPPYTAQERTWIDAAVKALIRRAGEYAANPHAVLPQITLKSLPPLD